MSALTKITADAKRIMKRKKISWKESIKQASALYRSKMKKTTGKKIGAARKKKVARKKKAAVKFKVVDRKITTSERAIGSVIPGGKAARIRELHDELKRLESIRIALKDKAATTKIKPQKKKILDAAAYYTRLIAQAENNIRLLRKMR